MAKFDEEEWKRRIAKEIADEDARGAQADRDRKMDAAFEREFFDALREATGGMTPEQYRAALEKDIPDVTEQEVAEAQQIIAEAARLAKKGKHKKAKAKLDNKVVRKVGKAAKKGRGCVITLLFMITVGGGAFGATVWGAVEVMSALGR